MLNYILMALASLPFIGFLRASVENKKPKYLIDIQAVIKKWQSGNTWVAWLSPIFAVFLFLYNIFAWIAYGFTSVFDFLAFLFKKVWWVLMWLWNEVLHPTVFSAIKLLWHYLVVLAWKYFRFTCQLLPETYKIERVKFAFKRLLFFFGISTAVLLFYLLTKHIIVLVLVSLIVFYLFQYTVFVSIANYRSEKFAEGFISISLKLSVLWLTMAASSTALLVALKSYRHLIVINSLNVLLIQVLFPVAILFGLAFIATTFYLPVFLSEKDDEKDFDVLDFLKALLIRFPKLIASRPFKAFGMGIASILPFIFVIFINLALKEFTSFSIKEWTTYSVDMQNHIPSLMKNGKVIKDYKFQQAIVQKERDSVDAVYADYIETIVSEKNHVSVLKSKITDKKIHSLKRQVYVGENQSFSIPALDSCIHFEWIVRNADNNNLVRRETMSESDQKSVLFYHNWNRAGTYKISLRSLSDCNDPVDDIVLVEVIEKPDDLNLDDLVDDFVVSREAADYAIDRLDLQLAEFEREKNEATGVIDTDLRYHAFKIKGLKQSSLNHSFSLIAKIFSLFGLAFLLVLYLSLVWTYFLIFEFEIYSFKQANKHYYQEIYHGLKTKNSNQPLLGIFVLLVILLLMSCAFLFDKLIAMFELLLTYF